MNAKDKAEGLLKSIRVIGADLERLREARDKEIEEIRAKHKPMVEAAGKALDKDAKALVKLMKKKHGDLFGEKDRAELVNGVLFYAREAKVSIPRGKDQKAGIIALIEEYGWEEGLVITKDLDRPVIEKWPDEKLAVIGAERKMTDAYTYDLVQKQQGGQGD